MASARNLVVGVAVTVGAVGAVGAVVVADSLVMEAAAAVDSGVA